MAEKTSWDTESGLLDDYDFAVKEAWFGTDDEVENPDDRIFLFLRGEATVDGELEDDEHRERYSTGKNWEVVEDGAEVENATGKNRFNQNAGVGRLINALVKVDDGDTAKALAAKGEAYEAATFNGLNMHMERKIVSRWTDSDTGEELEWALALPTSVELKAKSKSKSKKGGSGKAGRAKGKGTTPSLRSDIIAFAGEFEDDEHDDFVDQVLDDAVFARAEEIQDDDELHAEVLDADSKLWAEAH